MKQVEYAIRALVFLAREDRRIFVRDIAQKISAPPFLLAKILQTLARHGIVSTMKGPTGGFLLTDADSVTIARVIEIIEGRQPEYPFVKPQTRQKIATYQARTTIAELARKRSAA